MQLDITHSKDSDALSRRRGVKCEHTLVLCARPALDRHLDSTESDETVEGRLRISKEG